MSIPMSTSILLKRKHDLSILMHIPKALQKVLKMTSNSIHSKKVPIPNRITSSTNRRCVRARDEEILIPLISPFYLSPFINKLRSSMTKMNKRGGNGNPFLIPLVTVKNFEGVALTSTTNFAEEMQPIT